MKIDFSGFYSGYYTLFNETTDGQIVNPVKTKRTFTLTKYSKDNPNFYVQEITVGDITTKRLCTIDNIYNCHGDIVDQQLITTGPSVQEAVTNTSSSCLNSTVKVIKKKK